MTSFNYENLTIYYYNTQCLLQLSNQRIPLGFLDCKTLLTVIIHLNHYSNYNIKIQGYLIIYTIIDYFQFVQNTLGFKKWLKSKLKKYSKRLTIFNYHSYSSLILDHYRFPNQKLARHATSILIHGCFHFAHAEV